ncbi:MAG: IS66 family transposase, partial [Promethearchaeota archaeon]
QLIYGLDLTKHHIHIILQKAGKKAIIVNKRLDHTIFSKIHTVEMDEVFQGKSHVILGVAEKKTQYLLALKPSPDRTATSISSFAKRCCNIRVVITDLYSAYKTVIPNLFKKARHLACHVHVQRDSLRRMDKLRFKCNRAKKELTRCERILEKSLNKIIQLSTQKKGWNKN